MKKEYLIIISAFIFGILVWIFDSAADSLFFYKDSFLNLLILDVPKPEIFFRFLILISFTIFGIIISGLFSKQRKSEESLNLLNNELEQRVEARTKKLSEANELLNSEIAERVHAEYKLKNTVLYKAQVAKYSEIGSISQVISEEVTLVDFTTCWTRRINFLPMLFDFLRLKRNTYSSR